MLNFDKFDCSGHSCYAPFIKPWDPEKYVFPVETLPRLVNNTLYVSAAFSDSINVSCFDCILLEIENQKIIVQKTNYCPPWSNGCEYSHIDLNIPSFDNLAYSTANICDSTDIMTAEQSSINGEWYKHYDTLSEAKENY